MKKEHFIIGILAVLLLMLTGIVGGCIWRLERNVRERQQWDKQLEKLTAEGRKSVIIRRVSEQMEEVAYQQKDISDERRLEAVRQKRMAEQMQQLAEKETEKALEAGKSALVAYHKAEEQKRVADERSQEALRARLEADTLAGLALGRSLGNFAIGQYKAGNRDLAELLGYHSWKYTFENGGDCYQPAVLGALALVSESSAVYFKHEGAVRDMTRIGKGHYVSVSECGEVVVWKEQQGVLLGERVYVNPEQDFRKVVWNEESNRIYAVTHSGILVELSGGDFRQSRWWNSGHVAVCGLFLSARQLAVVFREGVVAYLDIVKNSWEVRAVGIQSPIAAWCVQGEKIWYADGEGMVFRGMGGEKAIFRAEGKVTALVVDTVCGIYVAGCEDGRIILYKEGETGLRIWSGHSSAITCLVVQNGKVISTAYDGLVNMWNLSSVRPEAVVVATYPDWIYCAVSDEEKIASGGASGVMYVNPVSPGQMAEKLKRVLKRDFTPEERAYYLNDRKGNI